jgi:tetratricopeptide (TPR) repeat protein
MMAAAALLLGSLEARAAAPTPSANADQRRLQESLVALRAADLVRERRLGSERDRRQRALIAQQTRQIESLLGQVRTGRAERATLRSELAELRRRRDQSLLQSAASDPEARRELKTFETQVASALARPQPAIRGALRTVAESDGRAGFAELRQAYQAAPAGERAALALELATLSLPLIERSALPMSDGLALWEEAMRLNPSYGWGWIELARLYDLAGRTEDVASSAARAQGAARDPVERLAAGNEAAKAAQDQGDFDGARRILREGLELQRAEHRRNPDDVGIAENLTSQLHRLAELEHRSGNGAIANALLSEMKAKVEWLRLRQPENRAYRRIEGLAQSLAARRAAEEGRVTEAEAGFARSIARFREEVAETPDSWRAHRDLGLELVRSAHFAQARGDHAAEAAFFEEARTLFEGALRREPRNQMLRADLGGVYQGIGTSHSRRKDYGQALAWNRRALQVARDLHLENPGSQFLLRNVGLALGSAAAQALMLEDYALAGTFAAEKVRISERLLAASPKDPVLIADLSSAYNLLGSTKRWEGDPGSARVHLERALVLGRSAYEAAPGLIRSRGAVVGPLFALAGLNKDGRLWRELCTLLEGARADGTLQAYEADMLKLAQEHCR